MSYDISFAATCCHATTEYVNITYNLHDMMVAAGVGVNEHLVGKTGAEVAMLITNALIDMHKDPEKYQKLNPPNGWGSYDCLIEALGKLRDIATDNSEYICKA